MKYYFRKSDQKLVIRWRYLFTRQTKVKVPKLTYETVEWDGTLEFYKKTVEWCNENLEEGSWCWINEYYRKSVLRDKPKYIHDSLLFDNKEDAVAYKLRFGL